MTFRAKQPGAPRHRSTHDQEARQRLYVTVGFVVVIPLALALGRWAPGEVAPDATFGAMREAQP